MIRPVFIDTSAFIALENSSDTDHQAALAARDRLVSERYGPVTTNFVLDETYTFFRRSYEARMRVIRAIRESPLIRYEAVSEADELRAVELAFRLRDKAFSFTDLTSFAVMERLGIRCAFSFDEDFRRYGRLTVIP